MTDKEFMELKKEMEKLSKEMKENNNTKLFHKIIKEYLIDLAKKNNYDFTVVYNDLADEYGDIHIQSFIDDTVYRVADLWHYVIRNKIIIDNTVNSKQVSPKFSWIDKECDCLYCTNDYENLPIGIYELACRFLLLYRQPTKKWIVERGIKNYIKENNIKIQGL